MVPKKVADHAQRRRLPRHLWPYLRSGSSSTPALPWRGPGRQQRRRRPVQSSPRVWMRPIHLAAVGWGADRLAARAAGGKHGFLPDMDEGAFVLDYFTPGGTALSETDRQLQIVEKILEDTPEISGTSLRRTGAELGLFATLQNSGDMVVRLEPPGPRDRRARARGLRRLRRLGAPPYHRNSVRVANKSQLGAGAPRRRPTISGVSVPGSPPRSGPRRSVSDERGASPGVK